MDMSKNEKRGISCVLSILICALLLAGCAGAPKTGPFLLHPLTEEIPDGYEMKEGAIIYSDETVEAEVRPIDSHFIGRELSNSQRQNPFTLSRQDMPDLLIMEVRLKNKGDEPLYFNPANVRGVDNEGNRYMPMGFADFYQLHRQDASREEKLGTFASICYDGHIELKPLTEEKRYLPLSSQITVPKAVIVTIPVIYAGQESRTLSFVFEAFPRGEADDHP